MYVGCHDGMVDCKWGIAYMTFFFFFFLPYPVETVVYGCSVFPRFPFSYFLTNLPAKVSEKTHMRWSTTVQDLSHVRLITSRTEPVRNSYQKKKRKEKRKENGKTLQIIITVSIRMDHTGSENRHQAEPAVASAYDGMCKTRGHGRYSCIQMARQRQTDRGR